MCIETRPTIVFNAVTNHWLSLPAPLKFVRDAYPSVRHVTDPHLCTLSDWSAASIQIYLGGGDRGAEGAEGDGVHWGRGLGRPPPKNFFWILDLKMAICGAFLVQFFAVQLKLWGGEKILSPRYIFIGGGAIAPLAPPPGSTPLRLTNTRLFRSHGSPTARRTSDCSIMNEMCSSLTDKSVGVNWPR